MVFTVPYLVIVGQIILSLVRLPENFCDTGALSFLGCGPD